MAQSPAGQMAAPGPPLFTLGTDQKSKRPRWLPTPACTPARYEEAKKALGSVHLVENALWRARHFNYLAQVCSLFVSGLLWTIVGLHQ